MNMCVCERVNVLGVPEVCSLQRCQMLPATSVTRDPWDSCFVLGSPAPLSRYPSAGTPRDDGLPCHPHSSALQPGSLWPPRHLSPLPDCPRIPAKDAETWARGELIENQELNDTKKPWEMWEGEKGRGTPPEQDRSGTGCVCLLAGAPRGG